MNEEQKRKKEPSGKPQDSAADVRRRLRAARAALSEAAQREGSVAIMAHLRNGLKGITTPPGAAPCVAAFWPMQDEPDLRDLLTQWARAGVPLALPRVAQRDHPLVFLPWHPDAPMRCGAYGILEPEGDAAVLPDIVLVPTLGYTASGGRVGYGGGYYDRTLAAWQQAGHAHRTIGVAWRASRLADDDYAFAPHDMPLDAVVDEDGWHGPRAG